MCPPDLSTWKICKRYRMLIYERGVAKSDRYGNLGPGWFQSRGDHGRLSLRRQFAVGWSGEMPGQVFHLGVMIGAADFIDLHEERIRKHLGLKRKRAAKRVREFAVELHVFRRYWKCQVSPPAPPDSMH